MQQKRDVEHLIKEFIKKGGRIDSYYLKNPQKGPCLVFLKKWFRGKNVRDAIKRAYSEKDIHLTAAKA